MPSKSKPSSRASRTRYNNKWKDSFVRLLKFIFSTYLLDPVSMESGIPVMSNDGKSKELVVIKVDTSGSWIRGHALPGNKNMAALCAFIERGVSIGPHDTESYGYVRELLCSAGENAVYDRLERVSSTTGEFLSLALLTLRNKARGDEEYIVKELYEKPPSGHTRAVVLDFAGTLASDLKADSTWEKIWSSLNLPSSDFWKLHDRYTGTEMHLAYMRELTNNFRENGLTRNAVKEAGKACGLRAGAAETLKLLDEADIRVYIVSRSERSFIRGALGEAAVHVDEIHSNYFCYDDDGVVDEIVETSFDRQGKARFIARMAADLRICTTDVLFIGNSNNDSFARSSGARTLCVCPYNTNGDDKTVWDNCIKSCDDFSIVLDYLEYEPTKPDKD